MESVYRQERKSNRKKGQMMIQKTRVMLYVNDVEMICRFFVEKIGAEISETIQLPEEFKEYCTQHLKRIRIRRIPKSICAEVFTRGIRTTAFFSIFYG